MLSSLAPKGRTREPPLRSSARRSSNAARQAAWRQRQKLCKVVLPIELDEHALAEALIRSRWLDANETQDRELVARAVGDIISEWITRWL